MIPILFAQAVETTAGVAHALEPISTGDFLFYLFILVLSGFLGYEVIGRVSPTLHTPLMSATNAISGISLVASLVAAGGKFGTLSTVLGTIAVAAASINVVGGFMITDRMLRMFKRREQPSPKP